MLSYRRRRRVFILECDVYSATDDVEPRSFLHRHDAGPRDMMSRTSRGRDVGFRSFGLAMLGPLILASVSLLSSCAASGQEVRDMGKQ